MINGHTPVLLIVSSSSTKEPRQTFPKLPTLATAVVSLGVPRIPVADRTTNGALGSLLMIRMVAVSATPAALGLYATVKSTSSPGSTTNGVPGVDKTKKLAEPINR